MLSTPPAIIRPASPHLMARAAVPTASMPEPHRRLMVAPGTSSGRPASSERHAGDVAVVLAGLVGAAVDHVGDRGPVDLRVACHQGLDRDGAEVVGAHRRERAAVAAEGRADGVADEASCRCMGWLMSCSSGQGACCKRSAGACLQLVVAQALDIVANDQALRRHVDHGQVGVDARDAADAGQRIGAALDDLPLAAPSSCAPSSRRSSWRRWPGPWRRRRRGSRRLRRCASWRDRRWPRPGRRRARRRRGGRRASSRSCRRGGRTSRRAAASPAACRR